MLSEDKTTLYYRCLRLIGMKDNEAWLVATHLHFTGTAIEAFMSKPGLFRWFLDDF